MTFQNINFVITGEIVIVSILSFLAGAFVLFFFALLLNRKKKEEKKWNNKQNLEEEQPLEMQSEN